MAHFNKKSLSWILILTGLVFLFLTTAAPFLHNHNADFQHHEDCPVYQMEATIFVIILTIILVFLQILRQTGPPRRNTSIILTTQIASGPLKYRAPPV